VVEAQVVEVPEAEAVGVVEEVVGEALLRLPGEELPSLELARPR